MYYTLSYYPQLDAVLREQIQALRMQYDPAAAFTPPHITVLFPVPDMVGEEMLIGHVQGVLKDWKAFEIELGGVCKSRDHWLFLTLTRGAPRIKQLYSSLLTGILAKYRRDDIDFVPHMSLGLFLKPGCTYDWNNPQESDFDRDRFEEARRRAETFSLPAILTFDTLHLNRIASEIVEWATGGKAELPADPRIDEVREFHLRGTPAP